MDSDDLGLGGSSRNGGQICTSVKPSLLKLTKMFGEQQARDIRAEGVATLEWPADFMESDALDGDF